MKRTIRNTLIAVISLVILFALAGVGYVYLSAGSSVKQPERKTATPEPIALPKPSKPSPNAREQAAVESLISPVHPGDNSSLTVKTNATSTCSINVSYNGVASKDSGLSAKIANDYGTVTWSWTVDKNAPAGKWPIKVTCVYNKRSAVVQADLQVIK